MKIFDRLILLVRNIVRERAERRALRGLDPSDLPEVERALGKIKEETADPCERIEMIRELFDPIRKRVRDKAAEIQEEAKARYEVRFRELQARILAPNLPIDRMSIDHTLRVEKAKAMYNSELLKSAFQEIPDVTNGQRIAAFFLMALSFVGNLLTVQRFLGSDFLGSENLSMVATGGISAVLTLGECVALYILVIFMGHYRMFALKIIGLASALALISGLVALIFARGEFATVATQAPLGFIQ